MYRGLEILGHGVRGSEIVGHSGEIVVQGGQKHWCTVYEAVPLLPPQYIFHIIWRLVIILHHDGTQVRPQNHMPLIVIPIVIRVNIPGSTRLHMSRAHVTDNPLCESQSSFAQCTRKTFPNVCPARQHGATVCVASGMYCVIYLCTHVGMHRNME